MEKRTNFSRIKKFSAVMLVFAIIFCLTGCIRYEAKAAVKKDGTCDFSFTYAISTQLGDDMSSSTDSAAEAFEGTDWEVEDYDEKGFAGFTATLNDVALEDLQDELEATGSFKGFSLEYDEDEETYTLEWDASSVSSDASGQGVTADYLEQYDGYMKFVLELPGKVIESNGEESNGGKKIEWNLFGLDEAIHAEFNLKSSGGSLPIGLILGIVGGVVAVAIIVVVIVLVSKKKKNAPAAPVADYSNVVPQAPAAPQQYVPQAPAAPQVPVAPQAPVVPQAPAAPVAPQAPAAPQAPVDPQNPGNPTV